MKRDFDWADQYIPAINEVIYKVLKKRCTIEIRKATMDEDLHEATDIVAKTEGGGSIGIRVRRPEFDVYDDVTIRYSRPSGKDTEWQKLKNGKLKWYLYCVADDNGGLRKWYWLDGSKITTVNISEEDLRTNDDGTRFVVLLVEKLKRINCIVDWKGHDSEGINKWIK